MKKVRISNILIGLGCLEFIIAALASYIPDQPRNIYILGALAIGCALWSLAQLYRQMEGDRRL